MEGSGASHAVLGADNVSCNCLLVLPLCLFGFLLWPKIYRVPSLRGTRSKKTLEQN